ncbi:MAG TPA: hypothetical protein VFP35_01235 [Candidatus Saccharimonadales bacterium]|nr:hypothetical protein [Candidatus Saccharimonadales bacterium]
MMRKLFKQIPTEKLTKLAKLSWLKKYKWQTAVAFSVIVIAGLAANFFYQAGHRYDLTAKEKSLLSKSSVDLKYVKLTKAAISYNAQDQVNAPGDRQLNVSGPADSTGKMPYKAIINKKASAGVTFGDGQSDFSFNMVPLDGLSSGKYTGSGQTIFAGAHGTHQVLTLKRNGIKEDILLPKAPVDSFTFRWKLELGSQLTAKMMADGGVGIYSPDPTLFSSNLQIGDAKSQALITKARQNAKKDNLEFIIPAPYIKDAKGKLSTSGVKFSLSGDILTLTAAGLKNKNYPLTIDPTVVVTTTADFATGYDDGNIDYSTADEIDRAGIGTGTVGAWNYTSNSTNNGTTFSSGFMTARSNSSVVAYNGYLYIIGGSDGTGGTSNDCVSTDSGYCSGVQYAPINANGTVGAWHYTHNSTDDGTTFVAGFIQARTQQTSVAYNGYLYILGGYPGTNGNDCSSLCNGVQYAPINANGTVGAWHYTHNSTDDGTTFVAGFIQPRRGHTTVAYNGYLYVIGGSSGATAGNDCASANNNYCNGVQYAPINANGTVGAWHYTHNGTDDGTTFVAGFTQARWFHESVAYNGYLYISGGASNASANDCTTSTVFLCNGVQYAPINANGTIGAWNYTAGGSSCATWVAPCSSSFNTARESHTSVAYNGYLYIIGGNTWVSASDCTSGANPSYCNGVQYAPINANGTIGAWNYTAGGSSCATWVAPCSSGFFTARSEHTSIVYNGYIYILGGSGVTNSYDCTTYDGFSSYFCNGVQFASLTTLRATAGPVGAWNYTSNSTNNGTTFSNGFIHPRKHKSSVVYNGYLYVIGGDSSISSDDCNGFCSGVQFAKINSDGTIGTWHYTHNSTDDGTTFVAGFISPRSGHSALAYNGYLYILGGSGDGTNDCTDSQYCNGVQFAKINSDGTIGTWNYTHNSTDDGTTFVAGFIKAREWFGAATYNGYLYVMGGYSSNTSANDCTFGMCSGVQFAKINSDGTIGTWNYTHNSTNDGTAFVAGFTAARQDLASVAYKGYLYVLGGYASVNSECPSSICSGVQFAKINADGTVSDWNYTHSSVSDGTTFSAGFIQPRFSFTAVAYNGYIYIVGGRSNTGNDCVTYCSGVEFAKLNNNGTVGAWHYTHNGTDDGSSFNAGLITRREFADAVIHNGYIYVIGGDYTISGQDCTTDNLGGVPYSCNGVQYTSIYAGTTPSFGTDGTWNYTHNSTNDGSTFSGGFTRPRYGQASVAYNGYLYVLGGEIYDTSGDDCTTSSDNVYRICNGVQFAKINSDGTVGAWSYTHNSTNDGTTFVDGFTEPRADFASVAYGGYLYVIGGYMSNEGSGNDCTAIPSGICNGVQFAKINSDGTIGTWNYTSNSANNGSTFVAGFILPRYSLATAAYNGYLYIIGGLGGSSTYCNGGGCDDVQFAKINPDGTIGAWNFTHNSTNDGTSFVAGFASNRYDLAVATYNNYLYIIGGRSGAPANDCTTGGNDFCNGVQFAQINSNGTIGTWNYTSNSANNGSTFVAGFTQPRYGLAAISYNGYLYIMGGAAYTSSDDCTSTGIYCNGVQFAQINSNGTIGTWNYTHNSTNDGTTFVSGFTQPRYGFALASYNGYLYIVGGEGGSSANDCTGLADPCSGVQFISINSPDQSAIYEKTVDIGGAYKITNLSFSGQAVCGMQINYRVGDASGNFSSVNTIPYGLPATTYNINQAGRYLWVQFKMDDATCGTQSQITDFTVTYNTTPAAPILFSPTSGSTGVSDMPSLQLRTTDADSDYLQYKINICSDSACNSVIRTVDQASSQTGWSGQDQQGGTAYAGSSVITSSTMATYNFQLPPLTKNTQYWWEAYAIDPGGTDTWSPASTISTFTTGDTPPAPPTLLYPVSSSSGNSVYTTFQLRSAEYDSDYLEYWIDVCADSSCNTIVRSICQYNGGTGVPGTCTASQAGWGGQNALSGTAYSGNPNVNSSQLATHSYQAPYLNSNATYWWRAYAIDPGGSNRWSYASAIQSFVTAPTETHIQGNVKIQGNVTL